MGKEVLFVAEKAKVKIYRIKDLGLVIYVLAGQDVLDEILKRKWVIVVVEGHMFPAKVHKKNKSALLTIQRWVRPILEELISNGRLAVKKELKIDIILPPRSGRAFFLK